MMLMIDGWKLFIVHRLCLAFSQLFCSEMR